MDLRAETVTCLHICKVAVLIVRIALFCYLFCNLQALCSSSVGLQQPESKAGA